MRTNASGGQIEKLSGNWSPVMAFAIFLQKEVEVNTSNNWPLRIRPNTRLRINCFAAFRNTNQCIFSFIETL
jgi:hypothetical protein